MQSPLEYPAASSSTLTQKAPLPSCFLPRLPKSRTTLAPLRPVDLRDHIQTLRAVLAPEVTGSSLPTSPDDVQQDDKVTEPFEREWAENWLNGIVTRSEGWLEEGYESLEELEEGTERTVLLEEMKERETVLREASGVITMLAGCTGSGSFIRTFPFTLCRELSFLNKGTTKSRASVSNALPSQLPTHPATPPLDAPSPSEVLAKLLEISSLAQDIPPSSSQSVGYIRPPGNLAETHRLRHLGATSGSPVSGTITPPATHRATPTAPRSGAATPSGPSTSSLIESKDLPDERETLEVHLNDAALTDHLSVGVLTWASAILLGRIMAEEPETFFGDYQTESGQGPRVLELGAGTGLLGILGRVLLDRMGEYRRRSGATKQSSAISGHETPYGIVATTDYHPLVMDNLRTCANLNVPHSNTPPPPITDDGIADGEVTGWPGINVVPLDWSTYPDLIAHSPTSLPPVLRDTFDVILVADCVYDATHAGMIKNVVEWGLRLPEFDEEGVLMREGGTMHLLGPIRPTYAVETASIAESFPPILTPGDLPARDANIAVPPGIQQGFRLVTTKRSELQRMQGHGRADEVEYWWWEITWAKQCYPSERE